MRQWSWYLGLLNCAAATTCLSPLTHLRALKCTAKVSNFRVLSLSSCPALVTSRRATCKALSTTSRLHQRQRGPQHTHTCVPACDAQSVKKSEHKCPINARDARRAARRHAAWRGWSPLWRSGQQPEALARRQCIHGSACRWEQSSRLLTCTARPPHCNAYEWPRWRAITVLLHSTPLHGYCPTPNLLLLSKHSPSTTGCGSWSSAMLRRSTPCPKRGRLQRLLHRRVRRSSCQRQLRLLGPGSPCLPLSHCQVWSDVAPSPRLPGPTWRCRCTRCLRQQANHSVERQRQQPRYCPPAQLDPSKAGGDLVRVALQRAVH